LQHDDLVYVGRMLDMANKVVAKTQHVDRSTFDANEDLMYAVLHFVQIVGEAARSVSKGFVAAHPEVPWKAIIGMRMKIVHDYIDVNFDRVWAVAKEEMLPLAGQLAHILGE
jgi:uncharacterized protein with HEPN domain